MADILVADDTKNIREALNEALLVAGHTVRMVADGEAAVSEFVRKRPDAVLLDVMMPRKDGFEVCAEIRSLDAKVPIIFISAKGTENAKVKGLVTGADDYVVKPFGYREVLARLGAVLRRARGVPETTFTLGSCLVNADRFTLRNPEGVESRLSPRELDLVKAFAESDGRPLDRAEILRRLWGVDYYGNTRTLDQHVNTLRRKMGSDGVRIGTVPRVGYEFK